MKKICKALLFALSLFFVTDTVYAQSSADLELAKAMAKSYGYSEEEINQMLQKEKQGMTAGQINNANVIDRNASSVKPGGMLQNQNYPMYGGGYTGMMSDSTSALDSAMLIRNFIAQIDTIYGHRLFKSPDLNFVPNYNIPTPASYKLAPGDEVILDVWGATFFNNTYTVSPEGSITIENLGPVYLIGYTVEQAERVLKERMASIYSGISGSEPNTFLRLTLGKIRSLTVNVVGDAVRPGTFTLPSLSTVFTALYMAGGPTDIGSLRDVRIYRGGKLYKDLDFYKFLIDGVYSDNIRLEDDDVIMVAESPRPRTGFTVREGRDKGEVLVKFFVGASQVSLRLLRGDDVALHRREKLEQAYRLGDACGTLTRGDDLSSHGSSAPSSLWQLSKRVPGLSVPRDACRHARAPARMQRRHRCRVPRPSSANRPRCRGRVVRDHG